MPSIDVVVAREILDSRGNPHGRGRGRLDDGSTGRAAVPSGAPPARSRPLSFVTATPNRYQGKGVEKAVLAVIEQIGPELVGYDATEQRLIDQAMFDLDATENKARSAPTPSSASPSPSPTPPPRPATSRSSATSAARTRTCCPFR